MSHIFTNVKPKESSRSFYSHRHLPLFISNEVKKLKYRGKEYDYFLFTLQCLLIRAMAPTVTATMVLIATI